MVINEIMTANLCYIMVV